MPVKTKAKKTTTATVFVNLKEGVLDPQGSTIQRALDDLGYEGIKEVRSGRFFRIKLEGASSSRAQKLISEISRRLLSNPVIETFEIKLK